MAKEKKIGVSKIVINIGDKDAALTVEQAKELRDALNAVLGGGVEKVIERDRWYPYYPFVPCTWTYSGTTTGSNTTVTCGTTGDYTITLNGGESLLY